MLPAVLPEEVSGGRVDCLDHVDGVRHVHHAVVDERRPLLAALAHPAGPDQPQVAYVLARDLVERAVAPAVERAAPHEPVVVARVLEHRVRDRDEVSAVGRGRRLCFGVGRTGRRRQKGGQECRPKEETSLSHRTCDSSGVGAAGRSPLRGAFSSEAGENPGGAIRATRETVRAPVIGCTDDTPAHPVCTVEVAPDRVRRRPRRLPPQAARKSAGR